MSGTEKVESWNGMEWNSERHFERKGKTDEKSFLFRTKKSII